MPPGTRGRLLAMNLLLVAVGVAYFFVATPLLDLYAGRQTILEHRRMMALRTAGTVVAIDENPLKGTMVYQSLQADHYLEGEVAASLSLLVAIDGPDYAELGKPFGFPGQKVERPAELPDAIRNAQRAVEGGTTAILNVVLSQ